MGLSTEQARTLGVPAAAAPPSRTAQLIAEANARRQAAALAARGSTTNPADPAAQAKAAAGRAAKASGDSVERMVEAACRWYAARGRAAMAKQFPEVVILGGLDNDVFRGRFKGEAPVDYKGTVAGGRSCHLEVKGSATTNLPLEGPKGPTLRPEQARDLAQAHELGAHAAVLVCVRGLRPAGRKPGPPPGRRWYLLRWPAWLDACAAAAAQGAKSLSHEVLGRAGTVCPDEHGWPDWLAALETP